jgi:hypothetical protein
MAELTALTDGVQGKLPNHPEFGVGELDAVFDNTATSGIHAAISSAGVARVVMCPIGMRAAPAEGDPVYCGQFNQLGYKMREDGGAMLLSIPFGLWDAAGLINYSKVWGTLLHENSAETGANTATGVDTIAATSAGGWLCYQIFAANGAGVTATLSVEDSANNADWVALLDATTGEIDVGTAPVAGIIATHTDHTVRQYLRWQLALGTATSVTFALAYIKA